jgi:prepilin-type N-terminal cleavage/methylation domain-containing protein
MPLPSRPRRTWASFAGFTLAEILVALALIALLAAVLLPTVAGQILKGDAARVQQDLEAIRAGTDQFLADVHRYPGKYSDLSTKITTAGTHSDINGAAYVSGLVAKWGGPYVTRDTVNSVVETGFGGTIQNGFGKTTNTNGVSYLTIRILGISAADYDKIDQQVDGTGTACPACRSVGLMRFVASTADTTKFLATPIQ